jgi:hypothetical protein
MGRRENHLKVIVHPMLSQFYGMFLGFHLGWKTDRIMQVKFPLFPRDNCMSSPDSLFIILRDRDYVAMMYDVFHREESRQQSRLCLCLRVSPGQSRARKGTGFYLGRGLPALLRCHPIASVGSVLVQLEQYRCS